MLPIPTPDVLKVGMLCGVLALEVTEPVPSGHTTRTLDQEGAQLSDVGEVPLLLPFQLLFGDVATALVGGPLRFLR